ncbi:MAG: phage baseplate assembly protein [Janthinobacterium lividum]
MSDWSDGSSDEQALPEITVTAFRKEGDDDLILIVNGLQMSGWSSLRVTRGIERFPSDFDVEMTELYPDEADAFVVNPGDYCQVKLGEDLVLTGYVDRVTPVIEAGNHSIRVSGRSKGSDLVDCAAEWPGLQIIGEDVLGVARRLATPYSQEHGGIEVHTDVDTAARFPPINLMQGTPPFAIIESLCRVAALLAYDTPEGNLFLTRAGTGAAGNGFQQGKNIMAASVTYSIDQRFSQYDAYVQAFSSYGFLGEDVNFIATVYDPNVGRHRKHVTLLEAGDNTSFDITKQRAAWEAQRREGRSNQVFLKTDSWRDVNGELYAPNTLVPLDIPALKLVGKTWLISEVTYKRDLREGTTCDLVIMPASAFLPQPVVPYVALRGVDNVVAP